MKRSLFLTFILLLSSFSASASTVLINFEALPGPDGLLGTDDDWPTEVHQSIGDDYRCVGVLFSLTDGTSPILRDTTSFIPSSPLSLWPVNAPGLGEPGLQDLVIQFLQPVSRVKINSLDTDESSWLRAFNSAGLEIASDLQPPTGDVAVEELSVAVDGSQGFIDHVVVDLTQSSAQCCAAGPEFWDLLEFDLVSPLPPCEGKAFASDDRDNRNTQLFTWTGTSNADLGMLQPLADLETLALDQQSGHLYGITAETGELWSIDKNSGALSSICTIPEVRRFREIAGSSFHPVTGDLWVYQWNKGLRTLDFETCSLVKQWNHPHETGLRRKWDGLAWHPDGSVLYGSQLTDLYAWDPTTQTETVLCSNLPKKTEGLEYHPDGRLLGSSNSKIFEIDPDTCAISEILDLLGREDIESLTFE